MQSTPYNLGMDERVLAAIPYKFPLRYAVVVEKTDVAIAKSTFTDYINKLRKLDKFDEPTLIYNPGKIDQLIRTEVDNRARPSLDEWYVSLISYMGNGNRPVFLYVLSENKGNFKTSIIKAAEVARAVFSKLVLGSISKDTFYEIKAQFERTETVNLQKTNIQAWLDDENLTGVFQSELFYKQDVDAYNKNPLDINAFDATEPSERVDVTVADSWQSLFYEEIARIIESVKKCAHCGKPLPSEDYKGSYCPPLPDNKSCNQERQALRQKKLRSKRK